MRISDWSSDVCSSDLLPGGDAGAPDRQAPPPAVLPEPFLQKAANQVESGGIAKEIGFVIEQRLEHLGLQRAASVGGHRAGKRVDARDPVRPHHRGQRAFDPILPFAAPGMAGAAQLHRGQNLRAPLPYAHWRVVPAELISAAIAARSEEHTSELQSL